MKFEVYLNDLDPKAVRVELYADGINGGDPVRQEMKRVRQLAGASGGYVYQRSGACGPPGDGLYGASDTALRRRCGSAGSRSNPVATMMKTPQRELHDYISEISERADVRAGSPLPLGTQETGGGVNFAIFSRHASRVRLELFDHPEDAMPARVIDLDSARNRTGDVWHVWVEGIGPGQLYAYRVDGPYEPSEGHRFNFNKLLLDPFATAISRLPTVGFRLGTWIRPVGAGARLGLLSKLDNAGAMPKCVFVNEHFRLGWTTSRPGIRGRRRSFTKRMCAASPFIPVPAWSIPAPTAA